VRPRWRHTAARLWLKPPDELLHFLQEWLAACHAPSVLGGERAAAVTG